MRYARALYAPSPVKAPEGVQRFFFDPRMAWLWFVARLYLGWQWFEAGREKITDEAWRDGVALQGFWQRAANIPERGRPPIAYDWYRDLIQYMLDQGWYDWFAWLVILGQLAVGVALIAGAFVGVAAFFGAIMNLNFMMAGSASTNPILMLLGILLTVTWRTAGQIGLDRFLLRALGTPWGPGRLFVSRSRQPTSRPK